MRLIDQWLSEHNFDKRSDVLVIGGNAEDFNIPDVKRIVLPSFKRVAVIKSHGGYFTSGNNLELF